MTAKNTATALIIRGLLSSLQAIGKTELSRQIQHLPIVICSRLPDERLAQLANGALVLTMAIVAAPTPTLAHELERVLAHSQEALCPDTSKSFSSCSRPS
jgi:hypothetical protein